MISEHHFSSSYTSVWSDIIPLADNYWRRENLSVTREVPSVANLAPKNLRGFLNELAFETFRTIKSQDITKEKQIRETINDQASMVASYILGITNDENSISRTLDKTCENEVFELTKNLTLFFPAHNQYKFKPKFSGCGLVSACVGDIVYKDCLFEIKAGARAFRVSDIKQLLTYSSLAFSMGNLDFSNVGLFNPRTGHYWERTLTRLCVELSGTRESDVLSRIVTSMTQIAISR